MDTKDDHLVDRWREGDGAALESLIWKYMPLVRAAVGGWSVPGAEQEDLMQEGLIGLYGAARRYDKGRGLDFYAFAKLCVERRLNTAVKAALRGKHEPLRGYEPIPLQMQARTGSPEDILLGKEEAASLEQAINVRLSAFEGRALSMKLTGLSNKEIALRLDCPRKAVENAINRARKKLS